MKHNDTPMLLPATITSEEKELVALLKLKEVSSFNYLYDNYSGALYVIILQIIPDRAMANTVLQDVFLYIWHQIDSYDSSTGRLFTWMMRAARDTAGRVRPASEIPS